MEKLQVIALSLEIIGFGIALLHLYVKNFSKETTEKILLLMNNAGFLGMDYGFPAADMDKTLSQEERDAIPSRNLVFALILNPRSLPFNLVNWHSPVRSTCSSKLIFP